MKLLATIKRSLALLLLISLSGCAVKDELGIKTAGLTPRSNTYSDLIALPKPKGKIVTAVYNFRDQTGQYKPIPSSNCSTAVTQGATSYLITALRDSGWFIPVEREGLQNLLTERKSSEPPKKIQTITLSSLL